MSLILVLVCNAVAIWLATEWVDGVDVATPPPHDNLVVVLTFLGVALIFTIVNAIVKPIVTFFSLPFVILTLGLFLLVVNAAMLLLTAWLDGFTGYGLNIDGGLWTAIKAAIVIWLVNWVLSLFLPEKD